MQGYDNRLSHFINGQIPNFVREDHPVFVAFMEAYFEWLQLSEDGKRISPLTLLDQRDIDESLDSFVSLFREEYLKNFPKELAFDQTTGAILDERKLMKHIRAFYKAKGTEKAYRFLFQILYNTFAELYYPKKDILRLSDGKWNTVSKIKTTSINGRRIFDYIGGTISQRAGDGSLLAYAQIKDITQYVQGDVEVTEYTITNLYGSFETNRSVQIRADGQSQTISETVYTILIGFNIVDTGESLGGNKWKLYKVNDPVILYPKHPYGFPQGSGARASVSDVAYMESPYYERTGESDSSGPVKRFRVIDSGVNYNPCDWLARVVSVAGRGIEIEPIFGAVVVNAGMYTDDDGQPSSRKKLQDNRYYQEFSYVIKTDESYNYWIESIRKLIHPAGMAVFAQQYLYRISGYRVDDRNFVYTYEDPVIGHYTPYTFKTYENLRNNSRGVDLYPDGYNPDIGPAIEYGTVPHDPQNNPLSEGIDIGVNNIWCLSQDHNASDYVFLNDVSNLTGGLSGGTQELQAKHEGWYGCTGTGPGCCITQPYWIIYSHPNSRGIRNIPQYTCHVQGNQTIVRFNRFRCIIINDFFLMRDSRYGHEFNPDVGKFDGLDSDDLSITAVYRSSGLFDDLGRVMIPSSTRTPRDEDADGKVVIGPPDNQSDNAVPA